MTPFTPLLSALGTHADAALTRATARMAASFRRRRARATMRLLAALGDERLHDVGLTRDAVACGMGAPDPLHAARLCTTPDGLAPLRDGARRSAVDRRVPHERHLGW